MFVFTGLLYILILHVFTDQLLLHKGLGCVFYTFNCNVMNDIWSVNIWGLWEKFYLNKIFKMLSKCFLWFWNPRTKLIISLLDCGYLGLFFAFSTVLIKWLETGEVFFMANDKKDYYGPDFAAVRVIIHIHIHIYICI